ncbi:MAG: malate dehydrogenase [bacterium]
MRISVIGAGNVGATLAMRCAEKELGDIVLVDIVEGIPQGKALDLLESAPISGYNISIIGTNNYQDTAGSDVIVITSGIPRKPGMSREDLVKTNTEVVRKVTNAVCEKSPEAILIIVTNPLDVMAYVAYRASAFPKERVIGMAGILDTARFRTFIAEELSVSPVSVQACVLGGHGDSMVPCRKYASVSGIPVEKLIPHKRFEELIERTRNGGAEIVKLLKTGSAFYAPSAAACEMVESIIKDQKKILPCSVYCQGEYGIKNTFAGVPVKLGSQGVEKIVEVDLTSEESAALKKSAEVVSLLCKEIG